jgi:hypothetical protein
LFFLSGNLFFSLDGAAAGLRTAADIFPVQHFYMAMLTAFNPHVTGRRAPPIRNSWLGAAGHSPAHRPMGRATTRLADDGNAT